MPIDTDSGIHIYDGTESASPYKSMLNLLANSVKVAIIALKAMFTDTAQGAQNWAYNSCFDINQRGGISWTGVGWTVDRWYLFARVATTVNWITLGATETFFKTRKCIELLATATTNSATYVQAFGSVDQLDDIAEMRGQAVKFEVPMVGLNAASSATISIQKSATANRVTNTDWTVINSVNVTPGTAGTKAIVYATIPADATAAGVRIVVSTTNNPNGYGVRIGRITFAPGTTPPSQHRRRGFTAKGDERECMAHYVSFDSVGNTTRVFPGTAIGTSWSTGALVLPAVMRSATPDVEIVGSWVLSDGGTVLSMSGLASWSVVTGSKWPALIATIGSGAVSYRQYWLESTAAGGRIGLSAELK